MFGEFLLLPAVFTFSSAAAVRTAAVVEKRVSQPEQQNKPETLTLNPKPYKPQTRETEQHERARRSDFLQCELSQFHEASVDCRSAHVLLASAASARRAAAWP